MCFFFSFEKWSEKWNNVFVFTRAIRSFTDWQATWRNKHFSEWKLVVFDGYNHVSVDFHSSHVRMPLRNVFIPIDTHPNVMTVNYSPFFRYTHYRPADNFKRWLGADILINHLLVISLHSQTAKGAPCKPLSHVSVANTSKAPKGNSQQNLSGIHGNFTPIFIVWC